MAVRSAASAVVGLLVALTLALAAPATAEVTCFTHFEIGVLPGTEWGTAGPAVGDFDGDGDLDFFAGEQEDPDTYMDLVSKVWNTGGRPYHADRRRNDNPECGGAGAGRAE